MQSIRELRESIGDGTDPDRLVRATGTRGVEAAQAYVHQVVLSLLNANLYGAAGHLLWGPLYNPDPKSVRDILRVIRTHAKVMVLGCASSSKSYSCIAWLLMDWVRDPHHTECKVISTTAGHADENVFSTLHALHEGAVIPLPGIRQDGFIGLDPRNKHAAITLKSIPQGNDGKGALQGFHPTPRKVRHPQFGWSSRGRVFFDEAEEVPIGAWAGVDNLCSNLDGTETIKVLCATNPRDVTSILAQKAEPEAGWSRVVPDRDFEWDSRERWHVLRIDGAETENVKQGKIVYPGFLTLEGYRDLQLKSGGNTPEYWTFDRGLYPLSGTDRSLIPVSLLDGARGEFVFKADVVDVASVDLAFEGDDLAKMALLRYGEAIGWKANGSDEVAFFREGNNENARWCVQLDQILDLPKLRTEAQYEQVRLFAEEAGVAPEWLALDRTGNATGVYDLLVSRWDPGVMGITWGEAASDRRIMDESTDVASEVCDGNFTEMHWCLRQWIEFNCFGIGPHVDTRELFGQLSNRKVKIMGKSKGGKPRMRLQSKKEYKSHYGRSPDEGDAVVMGLHCCRLNGWERASMARKPRRRLLPKDTLRKADLVTFQHWAD